MPISFVVVFGGTRYLTEDLETATREPYHWATAAGQYDECISVKKVID